MGTLSVVGGTVDEWLQNIENYGKANILKRDGIMKSLKGSNAPRYLGHFDYLSSGTL